MSRRAVDPVDRAFDFWRGLEPKQTEAFEQRVKGYKMAMGLCDAPPPAPRKRRQKAESVWPGEKVTA